jgi:hypothetical protein
MPIRTVGTRPVAPSVQVIALTWMWMQVCLREFKSPPDTLAMSRDTVTAPGDVDHS